MAELTSLKKIDKDSNLLNERNKEKYKNFDSKKKKELFSALGWLFLTFDIKKKKRERIQNDMKYNDRIALVIALIGIICNLTASYFYIELEKHEKLESNGQVFITIEIKPNATDVVQILRGCTSISTIILMIFVCKHYFIRLSFLIFKQRYDAISNIFSTKLIYQMLIEIFICLIHSPPFLDDWTVEIPTTTGTPVKVDVDLFLSSLIPLRIYLIFRYYCFYSSWADDRAEKVCNDCNTLGGIGFAIKAELKERPYTVVGVLMLTSILIFGYALRNVELAFMKDVNIEMFQDWRYVWNGFWCIIITILTVGYGDYYPQTHLGRIIAVVACLWGTFLISLMVVSLTISVEFTSQEEKAFEELKKNELTEDLRKKAFEMIRWAVKLYKVVDANNNNKETDAMIASLSKTLYKYKYHLADFRTARKFVISKEHEVSAENILHKLNENVSEEMENLINDSTAHVKTLTDYLNLSQNYQAEISNHIEKLEKMTKGLHDCIS